MFQYDENLFTESENNVNDTLNILKNKQNTINTLLNIDSFEYSSSIIDLCSNLKKTIQNLEDLDSNMRKTLNIANNNLFDLSLFGNDFAFQLEILNNLIMIANLDSQIDSSSIFGNFTDFQNIMLSNLSFLELFYGNNEDSLKGKTIGELFLETYDTSQNYTIDDYLSFSLDTDTIISLSDENEQNKYRNLFLGKLALYGFSNIKVNELVNGNDGFDAIVVEDINGDNLVYFSCTDLNEFDDYLYDAYPILKTFSNLGESVDQVVDAKRIYESQQKQALELVTKYILNGNSKVNVGGFSLGGSLAEYSYFSLYGSSNLENLILFNPYHIDVDENNLKDIVDNNKLKLYVAEGDAVSTVLNYDTYHNYATPVFIDYESVIENGKMLAMSDDNLLNRISTNLKNNYCDNLIDSCYDLADRFYFKFYPMPQVGLYLRGVAKLAGEMKKYDVNSQEYISLLAQCRDKAQPILDIAGNVVDVDFDLSFIEKFENIEILFSGVHMPYSVEVNKTTSFDSTGKVLTSVNNHNVEYPSFEETTKLIFGSNIYEEIKDLIYDIEN